MEIGSLTTAAGDGAAYTRSSNADATTTTKDGVAKTDASDSSTPASQDDAVEISPQAYAAASNDASTDGAADVSTTVTTAPSSDAGESTEQANAQPMRSLVYGALGLARPDQPPDPNHAYSFGRWLAAGITIGGLISLFI